MSCVLFFLFFFLTSFSLMYFLKYISTLLFCCSMSPPPLFFNHFCRFVFFLYFILQLAICSGFAFWLCVFISFVFSCLISFLGSYVCLVVLFLFVLFDSVFTSFVCVHVFPCFCFCVILLLPFVWSFVCIFFLNPLYCCNEQLQGLGSPTGSQV